MEFHALTQLPKELTQKSHFSPYDILVIGLNSKREQLYVECRAMDHTKLIPGTVISSDIFYNKIKTIIDTDTKIRLVGDGAKSAI